LRATLIPTSYLVANGVILPITGWLLNYFGRKRLLLSVVTGFVAAHGLSHRSHDCLNGPAASRLLQTIIDEHY